MKVCGKIKNKNKNKNKIKNKTEIKKLIWMKKDLNRMLPSITKVRSVTASHSRSIATTIGPSLISSVSREISLILKISEILKGTKNPIKEENK